MRTVIGRAVWLPIFRTLNYGVHDARKVQGDIHLQRPKVHLDSDVFSEPEPRVHSGVGDKLEQSSGTG